MGRLVKVQEVKKGQFDTAKTENRVECRMLGKWFNLVITDRQLIRELLPIFRVVLVDGLKILKMLLHFLLAILAVKILGEHSEHLGAIFELLLL